MDPLTLAILGTSLLGTGGSLFGSWKANRDNAKIMEQAQNDLLRDKAELSDWKSKNSVNYMDSAAGQSFISTLMDNAKENNDIIASNSAMTGATNANVIAQKKASQSNIVDALRKLTEYGTQWKNQIEQQYFNGKGQLSQRQLGLQQGQMEMNNAKAQQWANFMQNLSGMATTGLMATGMNDTPWKLIDGKTNTGYDWLNNVNVTR